MINRLAHVCIYVRDTQEALDFYTEKLGFEKRMDFTMDNGSRWLTIAVPGQEVEIILHDPKHWHQQEMAAQFLAEVGRTPMWVFETDDVQTTYQTYQSRGVKFLTEPKQQMYGTEAVFEDLYGNRFLLLQLAK